MSDDPEADDALLGPIAEADWAATPCTFGRLATEADVREGRAAFFIEDPTAAAVSPATDVVLPCRAIQVAEDSGEELPVVVIQAERVDGECLYGVRYLAGGIGVCTAQEVRFESAPRSPRA